jgi:hypothetical protein
MTVARSSFGGYGGRNSTSSKGPIFFFAIFMAIGLIAVAVGIMLYTDAQEVKEWSQTTGTISYTNIRSEWQSGSHDSPGHYVYYPVVEYYYTVDGQTYYCSTISKMTSGSSDVGYAQNFINRNSLGSQVTVYYNPDNPSEAVLQMNSDFELVVPLLLGVIFTLIGASGVIYFYRKGKSG